MKDKSHTDGQDEGDDIVAASGKPLSQLELGALQELHIDDLRISRSSLKRQAEIARSSGYPHLAKNLERAAELTAVPNEELLHMYEMLRPRRATFASLEELARRLETIYEASATASFVREAAAVYRDRGLLLDSL